LPIQLETRGSFKNLGLKEGLEPQMSQLSTNGTEVWLDPNKFWHLGVLLGAKDAMKLRQKTAVNAIIAMNTSS